MNTAEKIIQINDLKVFLKGVWWLERRIDDRLAGQQGRLVGSAVFSPDGAGLHYSEKGQLVIGDHDGPAHQTC